MSIAKNYLKWTSGVIVVTLLTLIFLNLELIAYGIAQGRGQFSILWQAREVSEVIRDPEVSDQVKQGLRLVGTIREYAMNELGLKNSDNYTTFYDQKGEPILWVVTASEPYRLQAYEWTFPIVGTVPYKGYFVRGKAEKLAEELKKAGYDVSMRDVSGWSTLGWFRDPILSGMLERPEGNLADLIIHELTHATIFVKDSIEFNENLASFIGYRGALEYLADRYGQDDARYQQYISGREDSYRWSNHFIRGAERLDSLYSTFGTLDTLEMERQKNACIMSIINRLDTINFNNPERYAGAFQDSLPNNAWFMSYMRYRGDNDKLERLLEEEYKNDLVLFINEMQKKYPYL